MTLPPAPLAARFIGQSVNRKEDRRLLTGRGRYVDDVILPGMVHAAFVRSDFASARIVAIDTSAAEALEGVRAVFTATDLNHDQRETWHTMAGKTWAIPFRALADRDVRFVGDPVVMVVANSRSIAEDACELVEIDYEPSEAVVDYTTARTATHVVHDGDLESNVLLSIPFTPLTPGLDEAFADAAYVVEETIAQHRYNCVPMECRGVVAHWNPGDERLDVVISTQAPHEVRQFLSRYLAIPETQIHVRMGDVGGGFGQKMFVQREDCCVVLATRKLGVPVKWIEDRRENLIAAPHSRIERGLVRMALDGDARIQAFTIDYESDNGSYVSSMSAFMPNLMSGPYKIPRLGFALEHVYTNTAGRGAYRGPWMFETTAREMMMDIAARRIGVDPVELRRRNLLQAEDLPYVNAAGDVLHEITPTETLDQALAMLDYESFRREQAVARAEGRHLGVGVAVYVEPTSMTNNQLATMAATVRLEPTGTVTLAISTGSHGQSVETTMAQVVADSLGVDYEDVVVLQGDTDVAPFGPGTGGSSTAVVAGGAAHEAALQLRDRVVSLAAHVMEAAPEDLVIERGVISVRGTPTRSITMAEVADVALIRAATLPPGIDASLEASARYRADRPVTHSNAAHVCTVEVDIDSCEVRVLRYIVSEDCGRMINPTVVEGQIAGGVVQGLSGVLYEHFVYDADGNPLTTTLMDYLLATATEVPVIEIGHIETPSSSNPGGYKGMGEGGAIGSHAAVANAIADALAPLGVTVTSTPLGPNDIHRLLKDAGALRP